MKTDMSEHIHRHKDSHIEHSATSVNRIFVFCVVINLLFVIAEVIVGLYSDSMSLLSDAGHNMGDVFSLLLVLFAFHIAKLRGNDRFTYGYKRGTILISLVNALILIVTVGVIVFESIRRLQMPVAVAGEVIGWTAGAGIIVNGVTTILLMRGRKSDLNIRGAFLHMLTDTLVSVGVVISGLFIVFKNLTWIDPVISLIIAVIILISTIKLLRESLNLLLDAVPQSIDLEHIKSIISDTPGVVGLHHLHVRAMSTTENDATMHVILNDVADLEQTKKLLKTALCQQGVQHCTIECETSSEKCNDIGYNI